MSKATAAVQDEPRIERDEIESGLRAIKDDFEKMKESTLGLGIAAAGIVVLLLVLLAFIFGKRKGKKKYAFVEIRRV